MHGMRPDYATVYFLSFSNDIRVAVRCIFDEAKDDMMVEDTREGDFFCVSSPETCP